MTRLLAMKKTCDSNTPKSKYFTGIETAVRVEEFASLLCWYGLL